ncbi:hypothetical protein CKA32_002323 [Geitlerinema sp. FC II]|nr:hypothetical protein CKA32_002323 [Geitlerinema sp. FC II]
MLRSQKKNRLNGVSIQPITTNEPDRLRPTRRTHGSVSSALLDLDRYSRCEISWVKLSGSDRTIV